MGVEIDPQLKQITMITKYMNHNEVKRELDIVWKTLKNRIPGYLKKYRKGVNSKAFKHNDVLGTGEYDINGNRVYVVFTKIKFNDKLSDLGISYLVMNQETGAYIHFANERGVSAFIQLTPHSIERMKQRLGMGVKEFFLNEYVIKAETSHHLEKYAEYGYDDDTFVMSIGKCFFIITAVNENIVVKTTLDRDNIYTNQLKLYVDCKRGAERFADDCFDANKKVIKKMGVKKTKDIVRLICA